MGLFSFFARKKALTASPEVLEAIADRRTDFFPRIAAPPTSMAVRDAFVEAQSAQYGYLYAHQPAIRRVVDYIASNLAQLGLKLYERTGNNDRNEAGGHPAAATLRHPNERTTQTRFVRTLVANFCIYDNAYAIKLRTGLPDDRLTLIAVPPFAVGVVGPSYYEPDAYRIWRRDGTYFDMPPSDVIHWVGFDPEDPKRGFSKLETLRDELAGDRANQVALAELSKSGFLGPGYITRPLEAPDWDQADADRFIEDLANQETDLRRKPVLEEGMEFHPASISPKDAQALDSRRFTEDEVASLYGMKNVPPASQEERDQFYSDVLPPLCEDLAATLTLELVENEYLADDLYFQFDLSQKLQGPELLKTLVTAAGGPVLLRDEARARLDLPAVPGGDEMIVPLNVQVGENPKPSPMTMPIQDPNAPNQDGSAREGAPFGQSLQNGHRKADTRPRRQRIGAERDSFAGLHAELLRRHFIRQRDSRRKAAPTPGDDAELSAELLALSRKQVSLVGTDVADRITASFDLKQTTNYLMQKALGTAEAINQATAADIAELGADEAYKQAIETRAPALGMSIATGLSAWATKEAVQQSGTTTHQIVISGGDCEICAPFQGQWTPDSIPGWPAYHSNCNCTADVI